MNIGKGKKTLLERKKWSCLVLCFTAMYLWKQMKNGKERKRRTKLFCPLQRLILLSGAIKLATSPVFKFLYRFSSGKMVGIDFKVWRSQSQTLISATWSHDHNINQCSFRDYLKNVTEKLVRLFGFSSKTRRFRRRRKKRRRRKRRRKERLMRGQGATLLPALFSWLEHS